MMRTVLQLLCALLMARGLKAQPYVLVNWGLTLNTNQATVDPSDFAVSLIGCVPANYPAVLPNAPYEYGFQCNYVTPPISTCMRGSTGFITFQQGSSAIGYTPSSNCTASRPIYTELILHPYPFPWQNSPLNVPQCAPADEDHYCCPSSVLASRVTVRCM